MIPDGPLLVRASRSDRWDTLLSARPNVRDALVLRFGGCNRGRKSVGNEDSGAEPAAGGHMRGMRTSAVDHLRRDAHLIARHLRAVASTMLPVFEVTKEISVKRRKECR
jgi:hypothetical protein